jgi:hypothetical protein
LKTPQVIGSKAQAMALGLVEQGVAGTSATAAKPQKKEGKGSAAVATVRRERGGASKARGQ